LLTRISPLVRIRDRIRLAGGVEKLAETGLVEIRRCNAGGDRPSRGIDDFGAAAVVQRDVESIPLFPSVRAMPISSSRCTSGAARPAGR